jgi:hypothetical protein
MVDGLLVLSEEEFFFRNGLFKKCCSVFLELCMMSLNCELTIVSWRCFVNMYKMFDLDTFEILKCYVDHIYMLEFREL